MPRKCQYGWLHHYLDFTRHVEPPGKFHLWTGMSILASVTSRRIYLDRKMFKLYPNLYIGLVGPTGIGKSTAAEIGVNHFGPTIQTTGSEVMRGKVTSWYLYDWFGQMSEDKQDAVALVFASELKALIGDLNRAELVAMLTDIYGCPDDADYRTKSYGIIKLRNVFINLLTCSTPEWLTLGIRDEDISGGFTGRFIYVCEEKTRRSVPFPEEFYDTAEFDQMKGVLLDDLSEIAKVEGKFTVTNEGRARYVVWYNRRAKEARDERLKGYYSRKRDHMLRVAMLISLAQDDSMIVNEYHLANAQYVLNRCEDNMMLAFQGVVGDPVLRYREIILRQIRDAKETTFRDLVRRNTTRTDSEGVRRIIETLAVEGRISVTRITRDKMIIRRVD